MWSLYWPLVYGYVEPLLALHLQLCGAFTGISFTFMLNCAFTDTSDTSFTVVWCLYWHLIYKIVGAFTVAPTTVIWCLYLHLVYIYFVPLLVPHLQLCGAFTCTSFTFMLCLYWPLIYSYLHLVYIYVLPHIRFPLLNWQCLCCHLLIGFCTGSLVVFIVMI